RGHELVGGSRSSAPVELAKLRPARRRRQRFRPYVRERRRSQDSRCEIGPGPGPPRRRRYPGRGDRPHTSTPARRRQQDEALDGDRGRFPDGGRADAEPRDPLRDGRSSRKLPWRLQCLGTCRISVVGERAGRSETRCRRRLGEAPSRQDRVGRHRALDDRARGEGRRFDPSEPAVSVGVSAMGGRPPVYALTRTFVGPLFATPRGIDRVHFLLARHFSQDSRRNFFGILPTPWGMRVYEADRVQRGLARLEELWAETTEPANDLAYQNLVGAIAGRGSNGPSSPRNALGGLRRGQRMASLLAAAGFSIGRSAIASVPKNAIYFNVGHYTLAIPQFLAWLDRRRDVKPVLMLHDTIPLDGPELVSPDSARHHATMVRSVARYGAGLIVTTAHARDTILRALAAAGRSGIRTLSIALPLAEPRKNHLLLFNVWRLLCASPESAPHLLVVGSPGWRGQSILDQMFRCPATRGKIHHVAGLSTQAMKSLIAGSLGLLSPSLAEGFGLPIIEALHLGAPVVASDIPAHREVAGDNATLLDPTDEPAWLSAISALNSNQSRRRAARSATDASRERVACLNAICEFLEAT